MNRSMKLFSHSMKLIALLMIDLLFATLAAAVLAAGFPSTALGYVDPSVMTYTIQALAGAAVALSAVVGVFWRRVRRYTLRLLNIDENHGKEVEGDVHRLRDGQALCQSEEATGAAAAGVSGTASAKGKRSPGSTPTPWPKRFGMALLVAAFVMYTYFIVAPVELVDGNVASLSFSVKDIWVPMTIFSVVVGTVIALGISCLKGRAFSIALAVFFAFGLCGFLQAIAFNGGLPGGDSQDVNWASFSVTMIWNSLVWVALFAGAVLLALKKSAFSRMVCMVLAAFLIVVQSVGIAGPIKHNILMPDAAQVNLTKEGLFDVAPDNNVIVFILDTMDNVEVERVRETNPAVFDPFTGFTYFRNSTGVMQATRYAVPHLFTGEAPRDDDTPETYLKERWDRSNFLQEIKDLDYDMYFYSDSFYKNKPLFQDVFSNVHLLDTFPVDWTGTISVLAKTSLYRDLPWVLKPPFLYSTPEVITGVVGQDVGGSLATQPYFFDDVAYYNQLRNLGLSVEEDDAAGTLKIIHLEGSHTPYIMNENVERVESTTAEAQTEGTLKIVAEYLDQLKELGVYDQATIILTADHGHWYWPCPDTVTEPATPFLMVKPSESAEEAAQPCKVSNAPVSQEDFQATLMKAVGGDWEKYGRTYFDIPEDEDRVRYWNMMIWIDGIDLEWRQLKIDGDALDFDNWSESGKSWYFDGFSIDDIDES